MADNRVDENLNINTGACYYNIYRYTKEVIGNIYDNPELLEGGENNETPH